MHSFSRNKQYWLSSSISFSIYSAALRSARRPDTLVSYNENVGRAWNKPSVSGARVVFAGNGPSSRSGLAGACCDGVQHSIIKRDRTLGIPREASANGSALFTALTIPGIPPALSSTYGTSLHGEERMTRTQKTCKLMNRVLESTGRE